MKRNVSLGAILVVISLIVGLVTNNDMYFALSLFSAIIISLLIALAK